MDFCLVGPVNAFHRINNGKNAFFYDGKNEKRTKISELQFERVEYDATRQKCFCTLFSIDRNNKIVDYNEYVELKTIL